MASPLQRPLGSKRTRAPFRAFALKLLVFSAIVGAIVLVLSRIDMKHDLHRLNASMLSGSSEGNYFAIVARLGDQAARRKGKLVNVPTAGSQDNVARLTAAAATCDVEFALAQDGSSWGPTRDGLPTGPLRLVGRLPKPESVLFLGKSADAIKDFADLRGLRVGIGPKGSGTETIGRELFALPEFVQLGVVMSNHTVEEQIDLAAAGELDLAMMVIDADAAVVSKAVLERGLQIASFEHAEAVARRLPHLKTGRVGAGDYDAVRVLPPSDKRVMKVETLVLGNGCASRVRTIDLLTVLATAFPGFVRHNKDTPNTTGLPVNPVAAEYFVNEGPQLADEYVPWLVDVMPPANWAYVIMGVSLLFNAMGFGHRFRLWRIDAARVKLEGELAHVFGAVTTLGDIQHLAPDDHFQKPEVRETIATVVAELEALAARSRRYSLSVLVPMGQEMAYRYQEGVIYETLAVLRDFRKRCDELT